MTGSASQAANIGTTAIRQGYDVDADRLGAWMKEHVADFAGPLSVSQFKGGQSNPTYRLDTPTRSYVMRRKPPGELLKGAHAVEREARVLSALGGTGFPVPHVYGLCTDDTVIGTWFYVMDLVDGRIFWDARFPDVDRNDRALYFDAMNETLARLHSIDIASAGLSDFGKTGAYYQRQISRWSRAYFEDRDAGRDPLMDRLIAWLPDHIPPDENVAIIHGDYRCDNMVFDASSPRIAAVLDWELSTLGDPVVDFACHAMMYRMPPHIVAGLLDADLEQLGIPGEADYVAAYQARTGRSAMPHYQFAMAFNFFRMAAIFHGIKGRAIRGTAASAQARERAAAFPELARLAWQQAEQAGAD
ncbi:MAG TPA: phosphotransferase family protein [Sphingomonas sp.]|nr:phosphotransferase family protein [Sphingomonas sp.]